MTLSNASVGRTETTAAPVLHYVDWPAIFAGTVLAVALSFVLFTFGSAIGLSASSFKPGEGTSALWFGIASGLWFIWVAITSLAAGGYLAGRMRRPVAGASTDESETRDGAHGVLVWATSALVGALLATAGVSGVVGAAGSVAGSAAQTATEAIGGEMDYMSARLLQPGNGGGAADAAAPEARQDVTEVLKRSLADGGLAPEDRSYLATLVARQTGQTQEEASAAIDSTIAEVQAAYQKAIDAGEMARKAAAIAAFVVAATLMVGAAAAYFAATAGGDHRDRNVPFRSFGR